MSRATKRRSGEERGDPAAVPTIGGETFFERIGEPSFLPPADVIETPDALLVRVELSGVALDDMEVVVEGNTIAVSGEKRRDASCADASFLCLERAFGKFHRSFEMTGCVNMGRVTAVLREGVLIVAVPKCRERRGHRRRIPIAAGPE
ncbi:MAG: Hsp20/alpha crystallin family protein [Deltaproteobacteria bacterium]